MLLVTAVKVVSQTSVLSKSHVFPALAQFAMSETRDEQDIIIILLL